MGLPLQRAGVRSGREDGGLSGVGGGTLLAVAVGVVGPSAGILAQAHAAVLLDGAGDLVLVFVVLLLGLLFLALIELGLLDPAGALLGLATALLLLLLLLQALLLGPGGGGLLVVLFEQLAADELLHHAQQVLGNPVQAQGGGHGEADPQRNQGGNDHHGLHAGVVPRLGGLLVDGVGLHGDEGKHQAGTGGHHGQQEQGEAARHGPEFQSWNTGQIHQAQEIKVDGENPAAHLAHSGLDRLQVFRGDQGGQVKLVIAHIGESFAGLLDPAVAHRNGVPVHHLGNLVEYLHIVDAHHILNGLADDGVQGNQNQQREKRPQAAAHGVDLLPLIKLLDLQIIALTVSAVLLLQLLHLALKHVHLNHAPLALQRKREQDKLDNDRE